MNTLPHEKAGESRSLKNPQPWRLRVYYVYAACTRPWRWKSVTRIAWEDKSCKRPDYWYKAI